MEIQATNLRYLRKAIEAAASKEAAEITEEPSKDSGEKQQLENEKQQLEIEGLKTKQSGLEAEIKRLGDIHWARMIGLVCLFALVVLWLIAILFFVAMSGIEFRWWNYGKILKLSDSILIALIGSTTLNVLGLFTVAAKWLYGVDGKSSPEIKTKHKKKSKK